jgi:hypothetical protein
MKNRRSLLLTLTAGLVACAVIITPVIAEELFAFVTSVDVEGKKVTVVPAKGEGDSIVLSVTDKTEIVTGKGDTVDLEKLAKGVMKSKDAGKKGQFAKVSHDGKAASKITVGFAKKKEAN